MASDWSGGTFRITSDGRPDRGNVLTTRPSPERSRVRPQGSGRGAYIKSGSLGLNLGLWVLCFPQSNRRWQLDRPDGPYMLVWSIWDMLSERGMETADSRLKPDRVLAVFAMVWFARVERRVPSIYFNHPNRFLAVWNRN